jgi:hypothetical protein
MVLGGRCRYRASPFRECACRDAETVHRLQTLANCLHRERGGSRRCSRGLIIVEFEVTHQRSEQRGEPGLGFQERLTGRRRIFDQRPGRLGRSDISKADQDGCTGSKQDWGFRWHLSAEDRRPGRDPANVRADGPEEVAPSHSGTSGNECWGMNGSVDSVDRHGRERQLFAAFGNALLPRRDAHGREMRANE